MKTTLTQISNIFNLLSQNDIRLFSYHYGYRWEINQNPANNFDPTNATGRLFPSVMFDVPDNIKYIEPIDYVDVQEEVQITLYFDDLQGYYNDGSQGVLNPIEQHQRLKQIAEDFLANFRYLFEDKYGAGSIENPTFVQRSNLYNDKLITWEVSFQLTHAIPCTDEQFIIDGADFPDTLEDDDLERTTGTPPTACDRIISQLNQTLKLTCVLPTYDFADVATQNALSVQQVLDLKTWLLPQYDFSDTVWQNILTTQQKTDLVNYLLPSVDFADVAIQAIITTQQKDDLIEWLLPLLDFSDPAVQALVTPQQQTDLSNWLCGAPPVVNQYSMLFDGVNESINCYDKAEYNFTNLQPFSITAWVKSVNYGGTYQGIMTKRSGASGGTGWTFFFLNGDLYCLLQNGINYINMKTTGVTFTNNAWCHVALTVDGSSTAAGVKFYRDGVQLATVTLQDNLNATLVNTSPVVIGNETALAMPFNGRIGYSRLFDIALSGAQIITDYNGGVMLEDSPNVANQPLGWKSGQGALFATPLASYWLFPNELDSMELAPFSNNMEQGDISDTDIPA